MTRSIRYSLFEFWHEKTFAMSIIVDWYIADILSELNLYYIQQIGASLKKVGTFKGLTIGG